MRRQHRVTPPAILFTALATFAAPALAQDAEPAPAEAAPADAVKVTPELLAERLDSLYRSKASKGKMTMKIVTKNYEREMTMEMTTRGMDDTLIRIVAPRKDRGVSTLKKGTEMWNYIPKVRKTVRVPPSMMTSSWMGSDVTNDDLVRGSSYEDDYTTEMSPKEAKGGEVCVTTTPKPSAPVTWSRIVGCFDQETLTPTRQVFYDEKDRAARRISFADVKTMDGRVIPTRMTIEPLIGENKGNKTVMTYVEMDFDADVDPRVFSLSSLRRAR